MLACLAVVAAALELRAAVVAPFIVDVWGTADGLPQSSVIAITQTRDGYLWLGTLNGLVRFDGNSFTRFNVNNTPGLPSNGIIFLFEDSRTNLWVGTETAGLCVLQNGVARPDPICAGEKITRAFEDRSGSIWFGTSDGKFFHWLNGRLESPSPAPPRELFYLLVPGKSGVNWRLQNGGLEKWRGEKREKNFGPCPWTNTPVTTAVEDPDGNLVVGTLGAGVFWFDAAGGCRHLTTTEGLSHNFVLALCFDREGNLWVGTDTGGLDRVKRNYFATPSGLASGVAQSAAEDAQGGLWTTFNLRGLTYLLTNSVQNFGIGRESKAWSVLVASNQQVWAGTSGEGLFRFRSNYFQPVMAADRIGPQIFALFQSRNGKLWVGGQNGLGSYDGQNWEFFSTSDGLPPNAVRALAEDAKGDLWIGTKGGGLFSLRAGKISAANAPVKDISCLLSDRDDVLWVGTWGHGLARLAQGRWTTYAASDGLASDDVLYLAEDDLGNLWIGSYEGLMRAAKQSLVDFAANPGRKISCRTFLTRECSAGAQPAALRARDGKLWFPTIDGLVSVNPADLKLNTNLPPVVIESVLIDGVRQETSRLGTAGNVVVTLTPENEQLEIHFTSLNFSAPKGAQFGARFRYRLEDPAQKDGNPIWTEVGGERVARFNKLIAGKYVFHVIACNEDSIWNETGATLAVTVLPPFWREPWFAATALLIFIGVLAGTIYLVSTAKLKRQLRLAQQKELIEHERARIARDLHDQLGANLTQVTLLGEMAEADRDLPGEVEQHAQQICATARETTRSLDEIVWAVNPSNDTLASLANYVCKYAQDYFALAGVSYRAELPTQLPPTPILPEVRHNVFLAFKEAVNNVVKHAHATEAHVKLQLEPEQFILSVTDNGRGLGDVSEKQLRNGLKNMRRRLADVRGKFEIAAGATGGTVVTLIVPLAIK